MAKTLSLKQKHKLYEASVQCPEVDVEFMDEQYQKIYKKRPLILREDFGGTGFTACEWVKQGPRHKSFVIDLSEEPLEYGKEEHWGKLTPAQQKRVVYKQEDVLKTKEKADVIAAFNFSYLIFKERKMLLNYFKNARKSLNDKGLFMLDLLGGSDCHKEMVDIKEYKNHTYYWDCVSFNPIKTEVQFAIHFKVKKKKYKNVFTYDWRLWNPQDIRELLAEAGFSRTIVFWEGDDEDSDEGNGVFEPRENAENCDSWVVYIAALP